MTTNQQRTTRLRLQAHANKGGRTLGVHKLLRPWPCSRCAIVLAPGDMVTKGERHAIICSGCQPWHDAADRLSTCAGCGRNAHYEKERSLEEMWFELKHHEFRRQGTVLEGAPMDDSPIEDDWLWNALGLLANYRLREGNVSEEEWRDSYLVANQVAAWLNDN